MSRFFYTSQARESAIEDIKKQIEILGHTSETKGLTYQQYRDICKYLNMLKEAIEYEKFKYEITESVVNAW